MPRLRRSDSAGPGITRVRTGRGVAYRDAAGARITDPELLDRIASLAILPAWTDVWIGPYPNGHIQATGLDAAGRRQYLYHQAWREQKDRVKFDRMLAFAEALPAARGGVTRDLRGEDFTRERVLAGAFRMLDAGAMHVGSARYAEENGSFGLSTLLCAHAAVREGDRVELSFPAKSGQAWQARIHDPDLAASAEAQLRAFLSAELCSWPRGDPHWQRSLPVLYRGARRGSPSSVKERVRWGSKIWRERRRTSSPASRCRMR